MDDKKKTVLSKVDHTILAPTATWEDVKEICDDALTYETASVCIPPSYVERVREYAGEALKICTVVGFPNGYMTTSAKAYETDEALRNGADEIDMVINLGDLKDGAYDRIENEIRILKMVCGERVLKVIIETCLLTEEEKIRMCKIVSSAGANYIKTSTGFSTGGATVEDVKLFACHVDPKVKIKAAGGINSFEDAEALIEAGASRLGSSRLVKLVKAEA